MQKTTKPPQTTTASEQPTPSRKTTRVRRLRATLAIF
jgi:hypothetical protein